MNNMSENEEGQESGAREIFLDFIKTTRPELEIAIDPILPESENDFHLQSAKGPIAIQLTELVERDFVYQKTTDKATKRDHREYIHNSYGHMPWVVDHELRDSALARAIETQIKKNDARGKGEALWLVIFSASSFLQIEWHEGEQRKESKALISARSYIANLREFNFHEVWFTNLETKPILIWPHS